MAPHLLLAQLGSFPGGPVGAREMLKAYLDKVESGGKEVTFSGPRFQIINIFTFVDLVCNDLPLR